MFRFSDRRARAVGLTTVLVASSLAIIGGSPATAATGSNDYALACLGNIQGTPVTQPVPFPITITSTTVTPDPAFPTGAAVQVTGDVKITVVGAIQAPVFTVLAGPNDVRVNSGSVNVTATNTSSSPTPISLTTTAVPMDGRQLSAVSTTAGSPTVTSPGLFLPTDVGAFLANASGVAGLAPGSTIIGYTDANTVTVSANALGTQTGVVAGLARSTEFTNTNVNLGSYTSDGASGAEMRFSLAADATTGLQVQLGLATGNFGTTFGACSVSSLSLPGFFGSTTLFDPPPVPTSQTLNVGTSSATPITLAAPSSDPTPATTFTIETTPAAGTLTVGGNPAVAGTPFPVGTPVVYNSGATAAVQSFQFSASDGVSSSAANGTVTLNVGTPTVQQPITQEITPGQLVLSCSAPGSAEYPDLTCDPIAFPSVELDGTDQTRTASMNQLHVSDNRGDVAVGWSLTAKVIDQTVPAGTFKGLVNTDAGADLSLDANRIEASYLSIGGISCAAVSPAPAAVASSGGGTFATDQALCSAAAGSSIGTFTVDGTFTLEVPSSKAAGNYEGTVEYLVI